MNCRDFEMIVTALARSHALDGITSEQSLAHTDSCGRCAARLAEERALLAGVQAVVEELAGEGAPARVEAALLLAFHEHAKERPLVLQIPKWTERRRFVWAAAAAAILAVVSTMIVSWMHARPFNDKNPSGEQSFAPPDVPAPSPGPVIQPADPDSRVISERRRRGTMRRAIRQHEQDGNEQNGGEIATEFLPLLDGDDLDSLDDSQLVRVELPGSALIAIGLPVGVEMANAPVKADVLLGHDGLARAIRFVR